MNHKNQRILKLSAKGLTHEQIAKKLGYQDLSEALKRIELVLKEDKGSCQSGKEP